MKTTTKILASILMLALHFAKSQNNIELSFIKLDEKENSISKPETTTSKDKALIIELFGLDNILNYQEVTCIIETKDFHVDEYTFPIMRTEKSEELYNAADASTKIKPGTKYKRYVLINLPSDDNPERIGEFSINYTRNGCGEKYLYSKDGCAGFKEYTLTAKVVGQNYHKKYDPNSDMYYNVPSHDPVLLSNIATIKVITNAKIEKQEIELTIGKKSDLFNLVNQANEQTGNSSETEKKKKK